MKLHRYISTITSLILGCAALAACTSDVETALPPELDAAAQVSTKANYTKAVNVKELKRAASSSKQDTARIQSASTQRTSRQSVTPFALRRCINMGNWLESPNVGDWGQSFSKTDFARIRRAGFDSIRLPVRWDTHMQHSAPYAIDPAYLNFVSRALRDAQSVGLGVVLDVHHYESLMANPARQTPRYLALWDQIATHFAAAPSNVYFELLNEPTNAMSSGQANKLYAQVIPRIRQTNPSRILIIGGNNWNSVDRLSKVTFPNDPNVIGTFHDYGPHEFTHQGAPWSTPVTPIGRTWGSEADRRDLSETYRLAREFRSRTQRRVFVGEFGVYNIVPTEQRMQWVRERRKALEANGIGWCAWDYTGAFNMYNKDRGQWEPGALNALFGP